MSKLNLAPGFTRFEHRHGLATQWGSTGYARGVKRQGDPGRIAPEQFYHLQNCRISGNQVVSRGGQSKVNSSAESGCILGIFDAGE